MTEAEITHIAEGFADLSLPADAFDHTGHWAAVVWLLHNHGEAWVAREMPAMIRAFNAAKGGVNTDTEGYHATITQASIAGASDLMAGSVVETMDRVLASDFARSDWVKAHWRRETLFSVEARRGWVEPDLAVLPFEVVRAG